MLKKTLIALFLIASLAVAGSVTVQPGDTLGGIATRYNTSIAALMKLNNLPNQNIRVGQQLQLPQSAGITVQPGDTLEAIAKRNGVTVADLRRANNLSSDALRPGQTLRLPSNSGASETKAPAKQSGSSPTAPKPVLALNGTYTVQSGDTLGAIAARFNVSVEKLKAANQLSDDRLRLGQVLKVSTPQTVMSKPKPSSAAPKVSSAATESGWVTVKPGDTLSAIAKRTGVKLETLRSLNGLTSDAIRDGQRLRTAAPKPVTASVPKKPLVSSAKKPLVSSAKKPVAKPATSSKTPSKPAATTKPSAAKPSASNPPATVTSKPVSSPNVAPKPAPSSAPKPVSSVAKPTPAPKPVATVAAPIPMDLSAAATAPTAPSDMLEGTPDFQIVAPNLPAGVNRFERLLWPISGILTSRFGYRWGRLHTGLDIATPTGTSVYAALSGTVQFAGWNSFGYGYLVVIRGVDNHDYYYAHNSRLLVGRGQFVAQGKLISRSGSTGNSTGPHLHFEIRINGQARNPLAYLPSSQVLQARYAGK